MYALVLRPFGRKQDIDFDRVERELIQPALRGSGLDGLGMPDADEPAWRDSMVEQLLAADLVIADLSIDGAGISYQLGLAHALRPRRTVTIKAETTRPGILDLLSQRCIGYDPERPETALARLTAALRHSLGSEQVDSPVYVLLPGLQPPRPPSLPEGFMADITRAGEARDLGQLRLLSHEARRFQWKLEALKAVGLMQRGARDMGGAVETFEHAQSLAPEDASILLTLGTLYQRQNRHRRADALLSRALATMPDGSAERAEALALLGRSAKRQWSESWTALERTARRAAALSSPLLKTAYERYLQSFRQDMNKHYCGFQALSLGTIMMVLAEDLPDTWEALFDDDDEARVRLLSLKREVEALGATTSFVLDAASEHATGDDRTWIELTRAELALLTSARPARVAERFRQVTEGAAPYFRDVALNAVQAYADLEVRGDCAGAAIEVLQRQGPVRDLPASPVPAPPSTPSRRSGTKAGRALLFVGHAIDEPGRATPRFPLSAEAAAREAISRAIERCAETSGAGVLGVAGASSGGDILFHEACAERGIETQVCLAVPAPEYERFGVIGAGAEWGARFRALLARQRPLVLSQSTELPPWLRRNAPYDFRGRDIAWRYHTAAAIGPTTVIALWDGQPGATADLVDMARVQGAVVVVLDSTRLFG